MFNKNKNQGFTLIELLLVIAIIGVLSGIVTIVVRDHIERARIARNQVFSHSIRMVIGDQMVGNWPLDSAAGIPLVTPDRSGLRNDGTMNNFPANPWVPGVFGNALNFGGPDTNTFIDVGNNPILNPSNITIEAWINQTTQGTERRIFTNHVNGMVWESYDLSTNLFIMNTANSGPSRTILNFPDFGIGWRHVVATYDGSMMRVFRDGIEIASRSAAGRSWNNSRPFTIGAMASTVHSPAIHEFHGLIDEVRIYRAAMPTSYVQKQYVQGIKSLASNGGITQEEKQERIAVLRNSEQLAIDLDAALAGDIDFSQYDKYLAFQK